MEPGDSLATFLTRANEELEGEYQDVKLPDGTIVISTNFRGEHPRPAPTDFGGDIGTSVDRWYHCWSGHRPGNPLQRLQPGLNLRAGKVHCNTQSYEVDSALVHLWGVFDGHALGGELAAEQAAEAVTEFLKGFS